MHIPYDGWGSWIVPFRWFAQVPRVMRVVQRRRRLSGFQRHVGASPRVCRHPADLVPSLQSNLEVNMKTIKSLVLGSAAALLAMSGAQAADLPVKAKAVEYVKVCSLYGAGFFYIPGTDTCIKLGGYLRVDTTFNGGVYEAPAWSGDIGQGNRYRDYFSARSRMALTVDTRTATEYGVVRTFGQADFQFTTLGNNTYNPTTINQTSPVGSANLLDTPGGGYVAVEYVFIQYAAQFGNGVSGTIGLDDPTVFNRTAVTNLSIPITSTLGMTNDYAGTHAPDVVGNIRIDQAWGLFQVSGALHEVDGSYNLLQGSPGTPAATPGTTGLAGGSSVAGSEISGHPE